MTDNCLLAPRLRSGWPVVFAFCVDLLLDAEFALDEEVDEVLSLAFSAETFVLIQYALLHIVQQVLEALCIPGGECHEVCRDYLLSKISLLVEFINVYLNVGILAHVENFSWFFTRDDDPGKVRSCLVLLRIAHALPRPVVIRHDEFA